MWFRKEKKVDLLFPLGKDDPEWIKVLEEYGFQVAMTLLYFDLTDDFLSYLMPRFHTLHNIIDGILTKRELNRIKESEFAAIPDTPIKNELTVEKLKAVIDANF